MKSKMLGWHLNRIFFLTGRKFWWTRTKLWDTRFHCARLFLAYFHLLFLFFNLFIPSPFPSLADIIRSLYFPLISLHCFPLSFNYLLQPTFYQHLHYFFPLSYPTDDSVVLNLHLYHFCLSLHSIIPLLYHSPLPSTSLRTSFPFLHFPPLPLFTSFIIFFSFSPLLHCTSSSLSLPSASLSPFLLSSFPSFTTLHFLYHLFLLSSFPSFHSFLTLHSL